MAVSDAVGKLCREQTAEFGILVDDLERRVQRFSRNHRNDTEIQLARHLFTVVDQMLIRLESLTATFLQIQNIVTSLQRYALELLGLLDYCEIFKPMINRTARCPGFDNSRLGAFVYNTHDAELLFRAGLPYWFVHPCAKLPQVRVDHLDDVFKPKNPNELPDSKSDLLYEGPADVEAIHKAIVAHTTMKSEASNPFHPASSSNADEKRPSQRRSKPGMSFRPNRVIFN